MIADFRNAFDKNIELCITETNSTLIEVYDCYDCIPPEQRTYIKTKVDEPIHFTLFNDQAENLLFAALDNCILKSNQQSRCDFIIGNFQKLYFIEIKQVKPRQRRSAKENAIRQLHASISFFREKLDLSNTKLIGVICLKAKQIIHFKVQNV